MKALASVWFIHLYLCQRRSSFSRDNLKTLLRHCTSTSPCRFGRSNSFSNCGFISSASNGNKLKKITRNSQPVSNLLGKALCHQSRSAGRENKREQHSYARDLETTWRRRWPGPRAGSALPVSKPRRTFQPRARYLQTVD